jgi:hypothetical protein
LLLKLGLALCAPIEAKTIAKKQVHSTGVLLVCLDDKITAKQVEALALEIVRSVGREDDQSDDVCFRIFITTCAGDLAVFGGLGRKP